MESRSATARARKSAIELEPSSLSTPAGSKLAVFVPAGVDHFTRPDIQGDPIPTLAEWSAVQKAILDGAIRAVMPELSMGGTHGVQAQGGARNIGAMAVEHSSRILRLFGGSDLPSSGGDDQLTNPHAESSPTKSM